MREKREKNTIYFSLNEKTLRREAGAIINVVIGKEEIQEEGEENRMHAKQGKEKGEIIQHFFTPEGKLTHIPAQRKKKLAVFEYMMKGFEMEKKYTEKEINEYIKKFHEDYATIRREFIMNHYMYRENGVYEMNPRKMWARIE